MSALLDRKKAAIEARRANGGMGIDEYTSALKRLKPKRRAKKEHPTVEPVSTMPDHAVIPASDEDFKLMMSLTEEEKAEQAYIEERISRE